MLDAPLTDARYAGAPLAGAGWVSSLERAGVTSVAAAAGWLIGRSWAGSTTRRWGVPMPSSCSVPVSLACLSWRTSCCNASRSEPMTLVVSIRSRRS